ncbi:hypothetical protein BZA77DRAFT_329059 [Pyronema omphalodes]|nr:hypothetical protein BZA77DRAFT_329059 [Pyronema omphalodes]
MSQHNSIFNPDIPLSAPGSRNTSRGPSRATSVVSTYHDTVSNADGDDTRRPAEYSDDEYAAEGERIDEALAEAGRSDDEEYYDYEVSHNGSDSEHSHEQFEDWNHENDEEDDGLPKQMRWGDMKDTWNSVEPFKLDIRAQDLEAHLDLGSHLMNAHLLRKMYPNKPSGKRKREEMEEGDENLEEDEDEEDIAKKKFFVRKSWTAWPLSAENVPREREHNAKNTFFIRRHRSRRDLRSQERVGPPPPPSEMLYQVLVATVIRKANERIRAEGKEHLQPSDDDEMLNKIIGPAVRQMMGKFDQLLMALHHERAHYIERLIPQEEGGLGSRKFMKVKKESGQELYQVEEGEREEEVEKPQHKKAQTKKGKKFLSKEVFDKNRKVRVGLVGLRNWSHVLGEAALIGWGHDVLEKTAKQCSDLFGEDMNFRTVGKMSKDHEGVMWSASQGLREDVSQYKDEPEYLEPGFRSSKRRIKMLTEQRMLRKQACAAKRAARYAAEGRTLPEEPVEQPGEKAGPVETTENKESDGEDEDMDDDDDAGGDGNAMGAEDEFFDISDEEEYEDRDD